MMRVRHLPRKGKINMKTLISSIAITVLIAFVLLALPVSGEEMIYEDVVRLHVLPSGDDADAQNVKILVRDAILTEYGTLLSGTADADEAKTLLEERLPEIETFVASFLSERGVDTSVSVTLGEEEFETRAYGDITLPRGSYTALTVTLGGGEGQNWWCVLYPALCTEAALGGTVTLEGGELSASEERLVTRSGYMLRFRTLEILEDIFS